PPRGAIGTSEGAPARPDQALLLKLDLNGNFMNAHVMLSATGSFGFPGLPNYYDTSESDAMSAVTSLAIGADGSIKVGFDATMHPIATNAPSGFLYFAQYTVLLGKSEAGNTAWLPWKGQVGRWRRFPVVASYDSAFHFQWAGQLIGTSNEG